MAAPCITIIQVGGESTSNFRALGSTPAPLFPLAAHSLLHHPVAAAAALPGMRAVFVLGFYPEPAFAAFCAAASAEHGVPVRYLCETRGLGSAGGMHQFRDQLLAEKPAHLFLLNADVCCAFPLAGAGPRPAPRPAAAAAPACGDPAGWWLPQAGWVAVPGCPQANSPLGAHSPLTPRPAQSCWPRTWPAPARWARC
jgi:hypothetical protein